ncbi:hypothetical protein [Microtetraspora glauca]|uniref:Uncharacterized protein n=1 Tax=Microtetraspora glauca TaxID=1996 RepID=A0ABV3GPI5_MICGL
MRKDEAALLRALDLLVESRKAWQEEMAEFAFSGYPGHRLVTAMRAAVTS